MLRNHLKVIFRNVNKNRLYSVINVLGLSMGYASFLLVIIFLFYETSFEQFHQKSARTYRVAYAYDSGSDYQVKWARVPINYINELPGEFPEVEKLIRFQNHERKYIKVNEDKFRPEYAYQTDNEVFEVLDIPLKAGNPELALKEPYSVVLTESLAQKYFGNTDVLGKDIFVLSDWNPEETRYQITGVMRDIPPNTHLPIDMLFSFKNQEERSGWAYVYILLKEGADIDHLISKIADFIVKYADETSASKVDFEFQPLRSIHLHSDLAREIVPNGDIKYVYLFLAIGIFILFVAMTNFTNLQSAIIIRRIKETGLRKILGAKSSQIFSSILMESILFQISALLIGGLTTYLIFPYFQSLTGIDFNIPWQWLVPALLVMSVVCGFLVILYPMLILNRQSSIQSLQHTRAISISKKDGLFSFKRILITLQYTITVLLLGSAFMARDQFHFLNESNLGITKDQILAISGVPDKVRDGYEGFKDQLLNYSQILNVTACMEVPSREIRDAGPVLVKGINNDPELAPVMDVQLIDHDYLNTLDIELVAGKNIPKIQESPILEFNENYTFMDYLGERPRAYLINETAMKALGWQSPEEALGHEISWSIGDIKIAYGPIYGIVKDYHQETLKNTIDPTIIFFEPIWLRTFLIKIKTENVQETIAQIQSIWDKQFPQYPMEYHFLDDLYEELYKNERVKLELLYMLSGVAILISFIGLFGLIAYSLRTRIKEIAIRKVLGADIPGLIRMISKEYIFQLVIASVIAIPISYYYINHWLQQFAYKTDISLINYATTVMIMAGIILITVSLQTIKTSTINPADTLSEE